MKSVLLNTTVIGSQVKLPRHPRLIIGEPNKYVHGDILDANAVTSEIDSKIAALIDNAPEALNTLKEIADSLGNDNDLAATLTQRISSLEQTVSEYGVNQGLSDENVQLILNRLDEMERTLNARIDEISQDQEWIDE